MRRLANEGRFDAPDHATRGSVYHDQPSRPFIECEQIHAGLAVRDIPTAIEFYIKKLGFQQGFT